MNASQDSYVKIVALFIDYNEKLRQLRMVAPRLIRRCHHASFMRVAGKQIAEQPIIRA